MLRALDLCLDGRFVDVADELSQFIEDGVLQLLLVHAQILELKREEVDIQRAIEHLIRVVEGKTIEELQEGSLAVFFDLFAALRHDLLGLLEGQAGS